MEPVRLEPDAIRFGDGRVREEHKPVIHVTPNVWQPPPIRVDPWNELRDIHPPASLDSMTIRIEGLPDALMSVVARAPGPTSFDAWLRDDLLEPGYLCWRWFAVNWEIEPVMLVGKAPSPERRLKGTTEKPLGGYALVDAVGDTFDLPA